ncbi:ribosomal protein S18 acetylase RimI-like enzyme [Thermocatellispora tengchongensis]|uniref:Ribosomal protein S18 acetylase RimI-like enzyme n=1 Tax=Thermocatellispora tengchongensis TaxID=1073253 RepID=A0A840NW99_9ACTN|nr:GNAT family N-acetyltransferase [Thermocatellispora tengchongensis]MBB5131798.1 ribosomal protein S18 acetylase RimI-like enzyme [Thermocatellispora tengchongensis]
MTSTEPAGRIVIREAAAGDAGEILTVQRAAYVTEAQLYGDPFIPPLVESAEQIRKTIEDGAAVLVATEGSRIVGSVRGQVSGTTCLVGRLVVAPDAQGRGIGGALLAALHERVEEREAGVAVFDLFTGHLSAGNLRLYRRHGYRETGRERVHDHLTLVHMRRERA